MTSKEFLKLGKRDFENGAVRDELYSQLKEKERMELIFKNMGIDYKKIGGENEGSLWPPSLLQRRKNETLHLRSPRLS